MDETESRAHTTSRQNPARGRKTILFFSADWEAQKFLGAGHGRDSRSCSSWQSLGCLLLSADSLREAIRPLVFWDFLPSPLQ